MMPRALMVPPGFPDFRAVAVARRRDDQARGARVVGRGASTRVEVSVDGARLVGPSSAARRPSARVRVARLDARLGRPSAASTSWWSGLRTRPATSSRSTPAMEPARPLEQPGAARVRRRPAVRTRLDQGAQLLEAAVDVGFVVEEMRADAQPVAAEVRADVAIEQRVADLPGVGPTPTFTTPPRAERSRGVRTGSPASSARAMTWSVSSPCRSRIRAGVTSQMMSSPPCAMKNTGAGGVPCSSRRAVGW